MPTAQQTAVHVLVVADDFTGANDAGVGLSLNGAQVNVVFDINKLQRDLLGDAVVINTDSRAVSSTLAAQRTAKAIDAWFSAGGRGWVFKKIDSTLRGNIGAEIESALVATEAPFALIAPASPTLGRVTREGLVWVNGCLLTDTEFASDPKTPVISASIMARVAEQTTLSAAEIHLSAVREPDLAQQLHHLAQAGVRLVVMDAETQDDLIKIISAANSLSFRPLLVGSSGLSEALAQRLHFQPKSYRPLLAVVGSMSDIAQKQIVAASHKPNVNIIDIDINALLSDAALTEIKHWRDDIITTLVQRRHCIIRTCHRDSQRFEIDELCRHYELSRQQLGETISRALGELVRSIVVDKRIMNQQRLGGLYLSGGDIAIAVATALGASGFQIKGQLASCVPWGTLLDSVVGDIPVMTKAGGFGNETTLLDVFRFIEEKASE